MLDNEKFQYTVVGLAAAYATAAHAAVAQKRKYTGEPYITHPYRVFGLLVEAGVEDLDVLAAAWLHDVVEDTSVTIEDVRDHFGDRIARFVSEVTDVSRPSDGNRATRKKIDLEHLAQASPEGKSIKLADLIDNTSTIVKHDPDFAKHYMAEKEALLQVLTEGNSHLYGLAWKNLVKYYNSLPPIEETPTNDIDRLKALVGDAKSLYTESHAITSRQRRREKLTQCLAKLMAVSHAIDSIFGSINLDIKKLDAEITKAQKYEANED